MISEYGNNVNFNSSVSSVGHTGFGRYLVGGNQANKCQKI